MSSNPKDIQDLFGDARVEGLDNNAAMILVDNLDAVALAGANGTSLDNLQSEDVTLVAAVLDASSSMAPVRQAVIDGFNTMLETFRGARQADSILVSAWGFDTTARLHYSYSPVNLLADLTSQDYAPSGGTALYDTLLYVMTGIVAYGQLLRNNGVRTRCIIVVFSDGEDNSSKATAQQVRTVSQSLLAQEIYTLAYAGFGSADLQRIANEIAFPAIITASSTPAEIRRIFQQVSTSVIRSSRTTAGTANSFFSI